jgi:hypothetical protein
MTGFFEATGLPEIIYIGGYGRSGSTILGMLLGVNGGMFNPGEFRQVFIDWLRQNTRNSDPRCSCGERLEDCAFWSPIFQRLMAEVPGLTVQEALVVTDRVEGIQTLGWYITRPDHPISQRYAAIWRTLAFGVAEASRARILIDLSKTSRAAALRPLALHRLAGLNIRFIHLVRDPRAVMWSVIHRYKKSLHGHPLRRWLLAERALFGWTTSNLNAHLTGFGKDMPRYRLRFEDLSCDPLPALERLGRELDLDVTGSLEAVAQHRCISGEHIGCAGRIKYDRQVTFVPQPEAWRTGLPRRARWIASLGWPLMQYYGY